jgi:hypothetical protein
MAEGMFMGPVFSLDQIYYIEERKKKVYEHKKAWCIILEDIDEESAEDKIKKERTKTEALYAVYDDLYKVLGLENERPWGHETTVSQKAGKTSRFTWH